jgi:hypothetical protein
MWSKKESHYPQYFSGPILLPDGEEVLTSWLTNEPISSISMPGHWRLEYKSSDPSCKVKPT